MLVKVSSHQKQEKDISTISHIHRQHFFPIVSVLFVAALVLLSCSDDKTTEPAGSSRAYQGHATDVDINNFAKVYQGAIGTRLDDCQTCHTGGVVSQPKAAGDVQTNPCDYCHYIIHPPEGWTGLPTSFSQTLNPYGADYLEAGRSLDAILDIEDLDSDEDGYGNADEIEVLRYPGNAGSNPDQPLCAVMKVTMAEIQAMPAHTQFGLSNTTKQQYDFYATFTGVKIKDLLDAKGIDLSGATSIDILAPDGYAKTFALDQITGQYPDHRFFSGFGVNDLGTDCAFVEYPANTYDLAYGDWIGQELGHEQWHMIAYKREGLILEDCYLDVVSGKIEGEGPLRNVIPPGSDNDEMNTPDRGKNWNTSGCTLHEWDYSNGKDHNAGAMVKGTVIIRINPMPAGCEEFDIINGGWAMIDEGSILIYGHNVE